MPEILTKLSGDHFPSSIPNLTTNSEVFDCLDCSEIFSVVDELWLLSFDYFMVLEEVYFLKWMQIKSFVTPSQNWEGRDFWRSITEFSEGLNRLKRDIDNRENLYEIFKMRKNSLTREISENTNSGRCYSEEDFFEISKPFFDFYIKYYECIQKAVDNVNAANSDEAFIKAEREACSLFIQMGVKYPRRNISIMDLNWILWENEVVPYSLHFKYEWRTITFNNRWTMSYTRERELQLLTEQNRKQALEQQALRDKDDIEF